jgi:hypothetical protein
MSSENFLSRWSRRKQEVRAAERPERVVPEQADPEVEKGPEAPASEEPVASDAGELSAEEIAKLPSLEDLTAETNLSMFLRKGVPEPLRNAALRRMWSLDPKIRDFVSEAREYAYDWNTPGGVPGFGDLPASEEVARMAARIVSGSRALWEGEDTDLEDPSKDREQPTSLDQTEASAPQSLAAPADEGMPDTNADVRANLVVSPSTVVEKPPEKGTAAEQDPAPELASAAAMRRHGGAMPL